MDIVIPAGLSLEEQTYRKMVTILDQGFLHTGVTDYRRLINRDDGGSCSLQEWGLDSLNSLEFLTRVEHEFHIEIPDSDIKESSENGYMGSCPLKVLADYVHRKVQELQ